MKILIVDDQPEVVLGMKEGINWEDLSVFNVYTAYGAEEARKILRSIKIDILLCDIEMPGENGLELCRWAREACPGIEFVILTSHAEFDYAKTALRLGSFDYILQPAPYEEIEATVRRLCLSILKKRELSKNAYEGEILKKKKTIILEEFLSEFYKDRAGKGSLDEIVPLFLEKDYNSLGIFPVLITMNWLKMAPSTWDAKLFAKQLSDTMKRWSIPFGMEAVAAAADDGSFWLFLCGELQKINIVNCVSVLVRYKENENETDYYTTLYYKDAAECACVLPVMKEIIEKAKDQVAPPSALYDLKEMPGDPCRKKNIYLLRTQNWPELLETYRGREMKKEIMDFFEDYGNRALVGRQELRSLYFELVKALMSALSKLHLKMEQVFPDDITLKIFSQGYITYGNFMGCVERICGFFSEQDLFMQAQENSVEQAIAYIKDNLDQNLSRNDVACHVHLNAEYFSRLFKKETGYTVGDFILQEKLNLAKRLLESTQLSVSLVALKSGYSNFSHFTQLFKKHTGMTPIEYRKNHKE